MTIHTYYIIRVWVHGCDPGRVSDGSRLALSQTLSIECPSSIFFWHVYFAILVPFSLSFLFVFFFCPHYWSLVDVPLMISFCPADHAPDWQPRIVLGMVEARSVNVKKKTTTYIIPGRNPPLYCTLLTLIAMQGHQTRQKQKVNVTTGYTLVKTRHRRVPTYLQREMDTADWSTPTFTLPCPKNGGVYPAMSTFPQNCTPIFRNVP